MKGDIMKELKIIKTTLTSDQVETILFETFCAEYDSLKAEYSKENCNKATLNFLATRVNMAADFLFLINKITLQDWIDFGERITEMRHS